jgi:ADP-ribose pyrophosphatase
VKDTSERWPVAGSSVLARSRLITMRNDKVRMPDNQLVERDVVEHPGAVGVLALDDANQVLMIRQYRHPVGRLLWEIPAGLRDVAGEDPWVTAQRELAEEASYRARDWHVLVDFFTSPGFSTERLRVYLARGLAEIPAGERTYVAKEEEAYLERAWLPLAQAVTQVLAGDLHNGVAAIGILAAHAASGDFSGLRPADAAET